MTELRSVRRPLETATGPTHESIVEVWEDGHFIAAIYPIDRGVKIVSKYLQDGVEGGIAAIDPDFPPALHVHLWDRRPQAEPPA